ncbi:MAG: SIMPL domain-containing protein [Thermonemataceae bacterium]|nr:SIMPL domain-containing protein [Thermonemataceae bacterium]
MKTNYLSSLIIAAATVITALIFANAFKNRNNQADTIKVTGLGKKDFISDLIVWRGSFSRKSMELKEAYADLDKDRESIKKYLLGKGVKEENIVFSSIDISKEFDNTYNQDGRQVKSTFTGHLLKQNVQIESKEVDKIEAISREVSELINSGIEFYSNPPDYYYTKLGELKIEMIAEATKDANQRATKIAENSKGSVGRLKKADVGVFQITAPNSAEDYSWGGTFNTSSKRKTATVTVKLEYKID